MHRKKNNFFKFLFSYFKVVLYYLRQRPMSCTIAFHILTTLAEVRPELVKNRKEKYKKIAQEMELPESEMKNLRLFP